MASGLKKVLKIGIILRFEKQKNIYPTGKMKKKFRKILLYILVAELTLLLGIVLSMDEPFVIRASTMDIPAVYDLGIDKITLEKIENPNPEFDYDKYNATLILHNYGDDLIDRKVVLHGDDGQKYMFVLNTNDGFTLSRNERFIVRNYTVLADKNISGTVVLQADLKDVKDKDFSNNQYLLTFN